MNITKRIYNELKKATRYVVIQNLLKEIINAKEDDLLDEDFAVGQVGFLELILSKDPNTISNLDTNVFFRCIKIFLNNENKEEFIEKLINMNRFNIDQVVKMLMKEFNPNPERLLNVAIERENWDIAMFLIGDDFPKERIKSLIEDGDMRDAAKFAEIIRKINISAEEIESLDLYRTVVNRDGLQFQKEELLITLLQKGATPCGEPSQTPLEFAIKHRHVDLAKELMLRGYTDPGRCGGIYPKSTAKDRILYKEGFWNTKESVMLVFEREHEIRFQKVENEVGDFFITQLYLRCVKRGNRIFCNHGVHFLTKDREAHIVELRERLLNWLPKERFVWVVSPEQNEKNMYPVNEVELVQLEYMEKETNGRNTTTKNKKETFAVVYDYHEDLGVIQKELATI